MSSDSAEPDAELPVRKSEAPTDAAGRDAITAWPLCPECGRQPVAMCPYCGTSGTEFPRADDNYLQSLEEDEPTPLALICPTCDEPWVPRFFRRCEWCGHDFGAGVDRDPQPRERSDEEVFNPRATLVVAALATIAVLVLLYFALLVR